MSLHLGKLQTDDLKSTTIAYQGCFDFIGHKKVLRPCCLLIWHLIDVIADYCMIGHVFQRMGYPKNDFCRKKMRYIVSSVRLSSLSRTQIAISGNALFLKFTMFERHPILLTFVKMICEIIQERNVKSFE